MRTVSPDMVFRGLFIASNPKAYLETLTAYERLDAIDRPCSVLCTGLRPPPLPFSMAAPYLDWNVVGDEYGVDRIACMSTCPRG
jgi:hypothetical protein